MNSVFVVSLRYLDMSCIILNRDMNILIEIVNIEDENAWPPAVVIVLLNVGLAKLKQITFSNDVQSISLIRLHEKALRVSDSI